MPTKNNNIIKYNHGEKSMKLPFAIYAVRMFIRRNEYLYK